MTKNDKTAEAWLQEENLSQALITLKQRVLETPRDLGARFFLFELLILEQDFSGVEKQLREIQKQRGDDGTGSQLISSFVEVDKDIA